MGLNLEIIKKVLSVLTVVLLMSSSLSAVSLLNSSISNLRSVDCYTYADQRATRIGFVQDLTHAEEHQVFLVLFDECESGGVPEIT